MSMLTETLWAHSETYVKSILFYFTIKYIINTFILHLAIFRQLTVCSLQYTYLVQKLKLGTIYKTLIRLLLTLVQKHEQKATYLSGAL